MLSRRVYVISLGLLLLVGAPIGYTRWLGRAFPADTTVEGAYLRVVLAVDNEKLGDAFAYLETEAQWACHTTFDYHKKIVDLIAAAYPEPERAAALARYHEAPLSADAPAFFAKLARSRGWEARLRRDLSGVARVEEQGERATLETARPAARERHLGPDAVHRRATARGRAGRARRGAGRAGRGRLPGGGGGGELGAAAGALSSGRASSARRRERRRAAGAGACGGAGAQGGAKLSE
ncbi:MAG: hypothetical protein MUF34_21685 [Polyangiaceae bacterium]|nr:hypothetical protein [Polyangiaceae bacterium]